MSTPPPPPPPGYPPQPPGYPPQPPGYPQYGYGGQAGGPVDYPNGTTILVLGILSLVLGMSTCIGIVLGPIAWIMGSNALREIDRNPGRYSNRANISAGRICGMIATIILIVAVVGFALLIVIAIAADSGTT